MERTSTAGITKPVARRGRIKKRLTKSTSPLLKSFWPRHVRAQCTRQRTPIRLKIGSIGLAYSSCNFYRRLLWRSGRSFSLITLGNLDRFGWNLARGVEAWKDQALHVSSEIALWVSDKARKKVGRRGVVFCCVKTHHFCHVPWIDFHQTFHEHVSRWWLATYGFTFQKSFH